MVPQFNWLEHWTVTPEVTGSSPVGIANDKLVVSFGANVVLTVEIKNGYEQRGGLKRQPNRQMSGIGNAADCNSVALWGIVGSSPTLPTN